MHGEFFLVHLIHATLWWFTHSSSIRNSALSIAQSFSAMPNNSFVYLIFRHFLTECWFFTEFTPWYYFKILTLDCAQNFSESPWVLNLFILYYVKNDSSRLTFLQIDHKIRFKIWQNARLNIGWTYEPAFQTITQKMIMRIINIDALFIAFTRGISWIQLSYKLTSFSTVVQCI